MRDNLPKMGMQGGLTAGRHCDEVQLGKALLVLAVDVDFCLDVLSRGVFCSFTGQMNCGADFAVYAVEGADFILKKIHSERASESPGIYRAKDMIHRKNMGASDAIRHHINEVLYSRNNRKDKIGIQCPHIILKYV